MTIIVKEGMEHCNHAIDENKGYGKKIMIFKEKPYSIDSLVQYVKSFAEGYSPETIMRVSKNVLKRPTLCLEAGLAIFNIFCRTPVVIPLSF